MNQTDQRIRNNLQSRPKELRLKTECDAKGCTRRVQIEREYLITMGPENLLNFGPNLQKIRKKTY